MPQAEYAQRIILKKSDEVGSFRTRFEIAFGGIQQNITDILRAPDLGRGLAPDIIEKNFPPASAVELLQTVNHGRGIRITTSFEQDNRSISYLLYQVPVVTRWTGFGSGLNEPHTWVELVESKMGGPWQTLAQGYALSMRPEVFDEMVKYITEHGESDRPSTLPTS